MYQFFVAPEQIEDKKITITGKDVNHIRNVLRMSIGEELSVSNGIDGKDYRCQIEQFTQDAVECTLRFVKEDGLELPSKVYLFQGLPKFDKMEFIVQKAVELGAFEVIPVATKRSIVKLDEKKSRAKVERWQAIAESAAKQSKRRVIPTVKEVMSFKEAIRYAKEMNVKMIPYELAEGMEKTRELMTDLQGKESIAIFIGPEGGFEQEEIDLAITEGVIPISLGKRILRTETAGLTTLSLIMYHIET